MNPGNLDYWSLKTSLAGHVNIPRDGINTSEMRKRLLNACGCPINNRLPTKLSQESFISMCLIHRGRIHGRQKTDRSAKGTIHDNTYICGECDIGYKIESGLEFDPPEGITFDDLMIIHEGGI